MPKYKTKDGTQDMVIPGVGVTIDGVIETNQVIENPNLELVGEAAAPAAPAVAAPQAAPVAQAPAVPQSINQEIA